MVVSGVNQNIEIFGRTFHVQSEMIPGDRALLRTTVFVGGRIIGVRETDVPDVHAPEEELRTRINEQHALIVENLHQRIDKLQAERATVSSVTSAELIAEIPELGEVDRPSLEGDSVLGASIRVRRLLARFRSGVDPRPPVGPEEVAGRLELAMGQIEEVVEFPTFADIRIDEQVRFNVLRDRIGDWLDSERDHEEGVDIWSDVAVFSSYLGHINDRRELIVFDRQMVAWALAAIAGGEAPSSVIWHLGALYGLDLDLDRLIDDLEEIDGDRMIRTLMRLHGEGASA